MLFQSWLRENIDCDEYRDRVRSVALGLGDLRACELEDLEEALEPVSAHGGAGAGVSPARQL